VSKTDILLKVCVHNVCWQHYLYLYVCACIME
jgi:hypothetical protein